MENFKTALTYELFSSTESNFGNPRIKVIKPKESLVSVLYLSKSKAVLTKKVFPNEIFESKDSATAVQLVRDTVYNDPLFSKKHSLDSIKEVLKISGLYINPVNEIIFIGYDNYNKIKDKKKVAAKNSGHQKENSVPTVIAPGEDSTPQSPFDAALAKALAGIVLLAVAGGWLSWQYASYRTKKSILNARQLSVA